MEELLELRRLLEQQRYPIARTNRRRKAGGTYLPADELHQVLEEAYQPALERAALEAFEGRYEADELAAMVDRHQIEQQALNHIATHYHQLCTSGRSDHG